MEKTINIKGHLAAIFCVLIWSITYISTKVLLEDFSPTEILFFRTILAYVFLFILSPKPIHPRKDRRELLYALAGLCGSTLYFIFQNIGLIYTTASNAGVIVCIAPMFTAIIATFLGTGEKIRPMFVVGFILAISGCTLIVFNGSFVLHLNPLGDILMLLGAVSWAFYCNILILADDGELSLIQRTRKIFFYGILFLLLLLPFMDFHLGLERLLRPELLSNMIFLGVLASGTCFLACDG